MVLLVRPTGVTTDFDASRRRQTTPTGLCRRTPQDTSKGSPYRRDRGTLGLVRSRTTVALCTSACVERERREGRELTWRGSVCQRGGYHTITGVRKEGRGNTEWCVPRNGVARAGWPHPRAINSLSRRLVDLSRAPLFRGDTLAPTQPPQTTPFYRYNNAPRTGVGWGLGMCAVFAPSRPVWV